MAASTNNARLKSWVNEWAEILQPDSIQWCDGSAEEYERLCGELVAAGTFTNVIPPGSVTASFFNSAPWMRWKRVDSDS